MIGRYPYVIRRRPLRSYCDEPAPPRFSEEVPFTPSTHDRPGLCDLCDAEFHFVTMATINGARCAVARRCAAHREVKA